jgi:hypothetical protein
LEFKAALDNLSYCPHLKCPLFIQLASNEQNSSLDRMNGLYNATTSPHGSLLSISPKTDRFLAPEEAGNVGTFLDTVFKNAPLVSEPLLTARGSGGSLYLNIAVDISREIESVKLYVAHSQPLSAYRHWMNHNIEMTGINEYISKVKVFSESEPVYAFVNVKYKDYLSVSSAVLETVPKHLNVTAAAFILKRRIYDSEMGVSEWQAARAQAFTGENPLKTETGPFMIDGVTSDTNALSTFVLADKQYRGEPDASLQLTVFSPLDQTAEFIITAGKSFTRYSCFKKLSPGEGWFKISLPAQEFRSPDGFLEDFNEVIVFEVRGESKFLINSVLWV